VQGVDVLSIAREEKVVWLTLYMLSGTSLV